MGGLVGRWVATLVAFWVRIQASQKKWATYARELKTIQKRMCQKAFEMMDIIVI
jgi:hypothetical protein